jgi:hypothetical protein
MFEVRVISSSGDNVALDGVASQSTTLNTLVASRAIDGNMNSFSHTSKSDDGSLNWWMVELTNSVEVASVEIINRYCQDPTDAKACLARLSFAELSLLDDEGSPIDIKSVGNTAGELTLEYDYKSKDCETSNEITSSPTPSPVESSAALPNVKTVRIHAVTGNPLNLFEVYIYSNGVNVAVDGLASQSSTLKLLDASRAIDGNKDTFTHTTNENAFSWWQVDLADEVAVESVTILNRYCRSPDDPNGCLCRLSHAIVSFFDGNGQWVASTSVGDTCGVLEWTHSFSENAAADVCTWESFD